MYSRQHVRHNNVLQAHLMMKGNQHQQALIMGLQTYDGRSQSCIAVLLLMFGVMQAHISIMEKGHENQQALIMGLQYVVNISYVEADEVLKICLDYWNLYVPDVYTTSQTTDVNAQFSFGPISTVRLWCSLLHA